MTIFMVQSSISADLEGYVASQEEVPRNTKSGTVECVVSGEEVGVVPHYGRLAYPLQCDERPGLLDEHFLSAAFKNTTTLSTMWKQPRNTLSTFEHRHLQLNKSL